MFYSNNNYNNNNGKTPLYSTHAEPHKSYIYFMKREGEKGKESDRLNAGNSSMSLMFILIDTSNRLSVTLQPAACQFVKEFFI